MPKPMLRQPQEQSRSENILSASVRPEQKAKNIQMQTMELDRLLRRPRSKKYMEAIGKLDTGGHTHNQEAVREIIDGIRSEFPELDISGIMLGLVAPCYLGEPYEVHTLDISGMIVEHYKRGQALPGGLEKARSLAIRGGYVCIEVYVDCFRAVGSNGAVSVIPC